MNIERSVNALLFGVEIPRERLLIAGICTAAAALLLLFLLIRWIIRKVRYRGRYGRGFRPEPYTAHRKKMRSARPRYGAQAGPAVHHSPPSRSRRRYDRGFRPDQEPKHRPKAAVRRAEHTKGGRRLR